MTNNAALIVMVGLAIAIVGFGMMAAAYTDDLYPAFTSFDLPDGVDTRLWLANQGGNLTSAAAGIVVMVLSKLAAE